MRIEVSGSVFVLHNSEILNVNYYPTGSAGNIPFQNSAMGITTKAVELATLAFVLYLAYSIRLGAVRVQVGLLLKSSGSCWLNAKETPIALFFWSRQVVFVHDFTVCGTLSTPCPHTNDASESK
jgi:hypothetical protein